MVKIQIGEHNLYYGGTKLVACLDRIKNLIKNKDEDYVVIVDGAEGGGKSVFAMQLGYYVDNSLNLSRICMTADEFVSAVKNANKYECVIYDEAFTGLSNRGSLSEINKLLVSMMMEMRQKNLFVIIVIPTVFLLEKYVALWRARALFHIYKYRGKKGFFKVYNQKNKKILFLSGKKLYNYNIPRVKFCGRFTNKYILNEEEYRIKKKDALENKQNKPLGKRETRLQSQRDNLIRELWKTKLFKKGEISKIADLDSDLIHKIIEHDKPLL